MATIIQLSPESEERLDYLVAQAGCSKEDLLRDVIARVTEDIEDCYLAHKSAERIRNGEEQVYSSEEIKAELGLDG